MHPRDVERLTIGEFGLFSAVVDEMKKQSEKQAREQRSQQRKR